MTKFGSRHICLKVTKVGSIIGHRIDYNGVRGSERPAAHTQQKLTQVTAPAPPSPGCSYLPAREKSNLFYKKGIHSICRSSRQIETYSFG